jgi:hypothetical protein
MEMPVSRIRRISAVVFTLFLFAIVTACSAPMSAPAREIAPAAREPAMIAEPVTEDVSGSIIARKVIANARLELIVDDTEESVDRITVFSTEAGGYVSQTNLYRDSYGGRNLLRGTLTLRVPAESLETILTQLEGMALEVRSKTLDREDVTDQYSDIEAQLRNLEATENELRELLAEVRARPNAKSEDILAVHRDLTEIRGEIERLQGRKNMLDNLIALSTVDVTLVPDAANRPVVEDRWRPATVVRDAARALVSALQFFGNLVIWVVVFLIPITLLALIPLAIAAWLIRTIVVRRRRKRLPKQSAAE